MFLPPEIRPVPRWERPERPSRVTGREKLATALIAAAIVLALLAPEMLGTVFVLVRAWAKH